MADSTYFKPLEFLYSEEQRSRFRSGELAPIWREKYPTVFDPDDLRLAVSQPDYHFFEWLTAILIFESTGYLSLVAKYDCNNHKRKIELFEKIAGEKFADWLWDDSRGLPDLFCYAPDHSDWFFCEAKGGPDILRPVQHDFAARLHAENGKKIWVVHLREFGSAG